MEEIWAHVPGYEGKYKVSNTGKIFGKRGFLLKADTLHGAYKRVCLYGDDGIKKFFVHRLVAMAFIPNPENLPFINHKDENPSNNCVDNLEWCTQAYNINYGSRNKKLSEKAKSVCQMDLNGNVVAIYQSANIAANKLGYDPSNIYKVCRGEKQKMYGYVWKWI